MLACTKQNDVIVKLLIEHGASPSLRNKDGWNSFHLACREGNAYIVSYLLTVDPTLWQSRSKNGRTPLHTTGSNTSTTSNFKPKLKFYNSKSPTRAFRCGESIGSMWAVPGGTNRHLWDDTVDGCHPRRPYRYSKTFD